MALNNLKTLTTKTAFVASVKLSATAANDRLGLGFAAGAYPADDLSPNPVTEQVRAWQERSAPQMRKQMRAGSPDAVPPAGPVGCLPPGSRAAVSWPLAADASSHRPSITTDPSRTRVITVSVARSRTRRDCQSPARICDKQSLLRHVAPATAAGK